MKLNIVVRQPRKKGKVFTTQLSEEFTISDARKLWEVEQILKNIPGSDIRVYFEIED